MKLVDGIYGEHQIDSPFLIDLINSPSVQRLKGIRQQAIPENMYFQKGFSRYEHSVGVMLLLRSLGASEAEQAAGLLHDVSHTAFSHLYDWVVEDYYQTTASMELQQDMAHPQFISMSELPGIAKRHEQDISELIDFKNRFGLLEREIPDLCADRLDYGLRELDANKAAAYADDLAVHEGKIVFKSRNKAAAFARDFLDLQRSWAGYDNTVRHHNLASVLRRALWLGEIKLDDFWQDDAYIMSKLYSSSDKVTQTVLKRLKEPVMPPPDERAGKVYRKFRYVDPLFIEPDGIRRLSDTDQMFRHILKSARVENQQGIRTHNLFPEEYKKTSS
jgi:uncharacterized protein